MSTPSAQCTILDGNTPCGPEFQGMPVLQQYFPTVTSFSDSINNVIGNLDSLSTMFVNISGCSSSLTRPAVNTLRYQRSVWCGSAVYEAISHGCSAGNSTSRGPLLCAAQCNAAVSSLANVLSNNTVCPSNASRDDLTTRTTMLDNLRNYCTAAGGSSPSGNSTSSGNSTCINGVAQEHQNCGWVNPNLAKEHCAGFSSDPCCQRLLGSNSTSTNSSSSGNNTSSSNVTDLKSLENSQNRDLSVRTPIWIPLLVVVVILGLLIPGIVFGWRAYKNQNRVSPDDDPFSGSKKNEKDEKQDSPSSGLFSSFGFFTGGTSGAQKKEDEEKASTAAKDGSNNSRNDGLNKNEIPQDAKPMIVIATYDAKLPDELTVEQGMTLYLIKDFGDGWGLAMSPDSGKMGAFPLVCCKPHPDGANVNKKGSVKKSDDSPTLQKSSSFKSNLTKSPSLKSNKSGNNVSFQDSNSKPTRPALKGAKSGPPLPRINALGQKMPLTIADGSSDEEDNDSDNSPISPLPLKKTPSQKSTTLKRQNSTKKVVNLAEAQKSVLDTKLPSQQSTDNTAMLLMPPKPEISQQIMASIPATTFPSQPMMMMAAAPATQPMMMPMTSYAPISGPYMNNNSTSAYSTAVPMAYSLSQTSLTSSQGDGRARK